MFVGPDEEELGVRWSYACGYGYVRSRGLLGNLRRTETVDSGSVSSVFRFMLGHVWLVSLLVVGVGLLIVVVALLISLRRACVGGLSFLYSLLL